MLSSMVGISKHSLSSLAEISVTTIFRAQKSSSAEAVRKNNHKNSELVLHECVW